VITVKTGLRMESQIRSVAAELAAAWNRGDWSGLASLFAEDADYVTGAGIHLRGRREIREHLSTASQDPDRSGAAEVSITHVQVRPIGGDVASALVSWRMPAAGRGGCFTLVLSRDEGAWRILTLHNTDRGGTD